MRCGDIRAEQEEEDMQDLSGKRKSTKVHVERAIDA